MKTPSKPWRTVSIIRWNVAPEFIKPIGILKYLYGPQFVRDIVLRLEAWSNGTC